MKSIIDQFHFKAPIHIRWRDLDSLNHVNNSVYLNYFEEGRIAYFNQAMNWDWEDVGLILARVSVDYKVPVLLNDEAYIYVRCTYIGRKSFKLKQMVTVVKNGKEYITTSGEVVLVLFDYKTEKTRVISEEIKQAFKDYEKIDIEEGRV